MGDARKRLRVIGVLLVAVLVASPAPGYIHFPPPTLQEMSKISTHIRVLAVRKHNKEKGVIVYEAVETPKGKTPDGKTFRHVFGEHPTGTKPIRDWVADGKRAVMFTIEWGEQACGYVFIDRFCYSVDYNSKGDHWLLIRVDPELAATFFGPVDTLRAVTKDILAGKEVKVPVDASVKALTIKEREKLVPAVNELLIRNRRYRVEGERGVSTPR